MSHRRSRIAHGVSPNRSQLCQPARVRRACLDADTVRAERLSVGGQRSRLGNQMPGDAMMGLWQSPTSWAPTWSGAVRTR